MGLGAISFDKAFSLFQNFDCRSSAEHSDYRTVSPYWVLPDYVELIRAVWADDGDRPLLFLRHKKLFF
jgi:hypothetical protein